MTKPNPSFLSFPWPCFSPPPRPKPGRRPGPLGRSKRCLPGGNLLYTLLDESRSSDPSGSLTGAIFES